MLNTEYADLSPSITCAFFDDARGLATNRTHVDGFYHRYGKRLLDLALVVLIAPMVAPIVLLAWSLTRLSGGSGFFTQPRIGRAGKVFFCVKIRTMQQRADRALAGLIADSPALAAEWAATQKLAHDPRITPLGQLLRRTSIDELPQLWNVLIGEMSLIGPRPFTPAQKPLYDRSYSGLAYYRMRPGISGAWQVECRNNGRFQERLPFDETYARKVSLFTDLLIAVKTIRVVFQATGK